MVKKNIYYYFERLAELWGWIIIVASFVGLAIIGGLISRWLIEGTLGIVLGVFLGIVILSIGIYIATKYYKGKGTIFVISRTIATPELDKEDSNDDRKEEEVKK